MMEGAKTFSCPILMLELNELVLRCGVAICRSIGQEATMALKGLTVVTAEHSEEGVLLEFRQDSERKIAIIQRVALDDTFDKLLPFGSPQRRFTVLQWNRVVQENLAAFERIIEAKYLREPSGRIEVDFEEIQRSGEKFTDEALRVAGIRQNH